MLTENKNEDYGGDYCNGLDELLQVYHTDKWIDHHQFDHFHWDCFTDLTHVRM